MSFSLLYHRGVPSVLRPFEAEMSILGYGCHEEGFAILCPLGLIAWTD